MATGDASKQEWWNKARGIRGLFTARRSHMPFDTKTWDAWYSGNFTPDRGQRDDDTHRYFYDEKSLDDFIQKENRKNGFVPTRTGFALRGYTYKKSWNAANAKFKVGDRVKAKNPAWVGYQGHALGTDVYTVKKVDWDGTVKLDGFLDLWISPDSLVAANSRAANKIGDKKEYYVVDEFGNVADGSKTPLPFDRASELFVKITGSKGGNGKWGIVRKGEPVSKARDWYGNIITWNAANSRACNAYITGATVAYQGSAWKVVAVHSVGKGGYSADTYDLKSNETGVVVRDVPEWDIWPKNTLPFKTNSAANARAANCGVRSTIPVVNAALNGGDDAIIRLCNPGNLVEASRAGSLHEVRYGAGFVYPLIGKDGVLVRVFRSLSEAHRSPLLNAARNGAASVCNDKWIDDFHVIVGAGKPDASLVEALKKKAKAWKIARRNFSDSEAGAAHDKAEEDAKAIAKRLGARWVQQGAVLKVVMPNAAANAVATDLRRYVPQKLIPHLEEAYKDSDGYWFYFDDGVENTRTGGGSTVHEDSISEAVSTMRAMRIVSKNAVSHNARPLGAACNAYAVDKNGRQIKKGMVLKDEDGDRFYVEKVLYKNVVEDEWGRQYLETDRWAEVVNG